MEEFLVAICIFDEQCCFELKEWIEDFSIAKGLIPQVEVFHNMDEFKVCIETKRLFDIIFTEVEFPNGGEMDSYCDCGIELGKAVRSYAEYNDMLLEYFTDEVDITCELFNLQILNFRFRPLNQNQIMEDIEKAYSVMSTREDFITYKKDEQSIRIALTQVYYAVASEKSVKIGFENNEEVNIYLSLDKFMEKYEKFGFLRCHRSYVVNVAYVETYKDRKIQLVDKTVIQVGNKYAENVRYILANRYTLSNRYF